MIFTAATQRETEDLARALSLFAKPGFALLLKGDLGSGKSTFARAFIRAMAQDNGAEGDGAFDVPSPSFSLIQTYDNTRLPVAHVDLYRLRGESEVDELGLAELARTHVLLIEWPQRVIDQLSAHKLILEFSGHGTVRNLSISASGDWVRAVQRNGEIEAFLAAQGVDAATRRFLDGDASFRRYELVSHAGRDLVLMDMPKRPEGPPVKDGKPYGAIAHLAEGLAAVVAITDVLVQRGFGAAQIHACSMQHGLALIENLGPELFFNRFRRGADMEAPMQAAITVLAEMAGQSWPQQVQNRDGSIYVLPSYDAAAQLIEVDLLPSWFYRHVRQIEAPARLHESFARVWTKVLPFTVAARPVWVLRDFHSPNLLWRPERAGVRRVGLIDTQDALLGHPAYDLASLLQDARSDIDFAFADRLYASYVQQRQAQGDFDAPAFAQAFAILGAQRATKILGIFARLDLRDGKAQYLHHMPRVSRYLRRGLQHPALAEVKAWFETHLPEALEMG